MKRQVHARTHFFYPDSLLHCAGLSTKHRKKESFLAPTKLWHNDSSEILQLRTSGLRLLNGFACSRHCEYLIWEPLTACGGWGHGKCALSDHKQRHGVCCWCKLNRSTRFVTDSTRHDIIFFQLTKLSTFLLDKLTVPQFLKKFPAFYKSIMFVTAFKTSR
jgi:hypothetical protein